MFCAMKNSWNVILRENGRIGRMVRRESTRVSLYRTIFPRMTLWLPEDEGAQLRFEFETELARLEAA
jgi:hypothetical protein